MLAMTAYGGLRRWLKSYSLSDSSVLVLLSGSLMVTELTRSDYSIELSLENV